MLEPCAFQYSKQASEPAVNIMLMRQAPLVGRAGGLSEGSTLEGGRKKKERKNKREKRGRRRQKEERFLNIKESSINVEQSIAKDSY